MRIEDIVADVIGSDMGVKTVIRLGGRLKQIEKMMKEQEVKIIQQEEAIEKCAQIIDSLRHRFPDMEQAPPEIQQGAVSARRMIIDARENWKNLTAELDDLLPQYEDSLRKSRTIRARKCILPGTVIDISGAELTIKEPTGPATIIKYGEELKVFPYQELGG